MKRGEPGIDQVRQLVSFKVENEEYGIDILAVQEIIRPITITHMPNAPSFVEGIINLRGRIVPVIDLRKRFGLQACARSNETRIVVVELQRHVVGFMVDSVQEVMRVQQEVIEPPPEMTTSVDSAYIAGVAKLEDRLLILLDLEVILSMHERAAIAHLQEEAVEVVG